MNAAADTKKIHAFGEPCVDRSTPLMNTLLTRVDGSLCSRGCLPHPNRVRRGRERSRGNDLARLQTHTAFREKCCHRSPTAQPGHQWCDAQQATLRELALIQSVGVWLGTPTAMTAPDYYR